MSVSPQAGWYPDPIGRYHYRYYDGTGWTANVATDGVASRDPAGLAPVGASPASLSRRNRHPPVIWYWVAGAVGVAAVVLAIVLGATALVRALKDPVDFPRAALPGGLVVRVNNTGSRIVYYEGAGKPSLTQLRLAVTGPSGQPVSVSSYDSSLTYDADGHSGVAVASFDADATGAYQVIAQGSPAPGAQIAVGPNIIRHILDALVFPLLVLGVGLLAAFVLALVTFVRRHASGKRAAA